MDIHRCRFVSYPPLTINALAFSHSHITNSQQAAAPRLAIGRANGDLEIWNPQKGAWFQETTIKGGQDRSIDGLVWTQDPSEVDAAGKFIIGRSRLFSIGYTTTVTEWNLETGRPLRQASGNHGEIWCLAAQPPAAKGTNETWPGQNLIAGCTDGALVLYSTKDEDLQLHRLLVRPSSKRAKIISVVYQDRNIVVAGCSDSTIRVYDTRNGTNVRNLSLGSGPRGGPKEIIVWSVKVLPNGDIVSGDSTGHVRIWNGKLYTQLQRIEGHKQDVLSLVTSFDGSTIFSGGMDRRTVVYKQVSRGKRWAEVEHRRYHTHDVKTMASLQGPGMSVVVSGGPDASPVVIPLQQFGFENQRSLPFLPQEPPLQSSPKQRLMMSFWEREVHIWRLKKACLPTEGLEDEQSVQNRKLVAKILIKGEANITSASLSCDGKFLAASTIEDIKLFQLRSRDPADGDGLRITKLEYPASFASGAKVVQLSPDSKWLAIIKPDNCILLGRLVISGSSFTIHPRHVKLERTHRKVEKHVILGGLGGYDRTITRVAFSSDSRLLAVSDLAGYIDTFVLSGEEDLTREDGPLPSDQDSEIDSDEDDEHQKPQIIFGQNWTRNASALLIPKLPSAPVVLSFRPSTSNLTNGVMHTIPTRHNQSPISHELPAGEEYRLLVVTSSSDVFEFEVLKGGLSAWSRRNPTASFPADFRKLKDIARGCLWDVKQGRERVWLYGIGWLWMFDMSRDFPAIPIPESGDGEIHMGKRQNGKKRKHEAAGSAIEDSKLGVGMSRKMQRVVHEEVDEMEDVPFGHEEDAMDIDEDEDNIALARYREDDKLPSTVVERDEKPQFWKTMKYRPILGICTIGESVGEGDLEVAIVERPIWEADLPPRYFGNQEWEKGSA